MNVIILSSLITIPFAALMFIGVLFWRYIKLGWYCYIARGKRDTVIVKLIGKDGKVDYYLKRTDAPEITIGDNAYVVRPKAIYKENNIPYVNYISGETEPLTQELGEVTGGIPSKDYQLALERAKQLGILSVDRPAPFAQLAPIILIGGILVTVGLVFKMQGDMSQALKQLEIVKAQVMELTSILALT